MNENKYNPNSLLNRLKFLGAMAIIFAGALLVILALFTYFKGLETSDRLDDQSQKISEIVQQNKELTQQNKELSRQAANYAYCNILLLSKYSQDQMPFTVQDANECVSTSFNGNTAPETLSSDTNWTPMVTQNQTQNQNQTTKPATPANPTPKPTTNPSPTPTPTPAVTRSPLLGIDKTPLTPGVHLTLPCLSLLFGVLNAC